MSLTCDGCGGELLEIDVKCPSCGKAQTSTGAHRVIGTIVLGQYEIVDVLGQGGMSVVYKGRHRLTDQEAALKILPRELAAHTQVKSRFVDEAKALAQLDHANIVHLYNFGEDNGCFVLAMQYVQGVTFERMILEAEELEWSVASGVTIDVLQALEYAHGRGIIHRDMKPSNILVRDHDGSATVMDFGIAKMTNSTRLTAPGQTMGTVRYMSPEQVRGHPVDARTDIYSLGATLYEAVCGDTPFDGDTHFTIMNKHLHERPRVPSEQGIVVPPRFERILLCALAKKPEDRFQSAREFRKELEALLRDEGVEYADSMRLSRDGLERRAAIRGDGGNVTAAAPVAESPDRELRSDPGHAPPELVRDRADDLRPGAAALRVTGPGDPRSATRSLPHALDTEVQPTAAEMTRTRSRTALWIALAGTVVIASAAVVFSLERASSSAPTEPIPAAVEQAAAATPDGPAASPEPFLPPGVILPVDRTSEHLDLRVLAPEGWDAERIVAAFDAGHRRFVELMRERGLEEPITRPTLSAVVVPRWVFCDRRAYESGRAPDMCQEREVHYRLKERTLFIADDRDRFDANVTYGNALVICLHSDLPHCEEVVVRIDEEFAAGPGGARPKDRRRERSRRRARGGPRR